jgi:hypothetical protein
VCEREREKNRLVREADITFHQIETKRRTKRKVRDREEEEQKEEI